MESDGEVIQRQHFCHHGDTICHPPSRYVTTKNKERVHVHATIMRYFQAERFSRFLPSSHDGHVNLAAGKHWVFMPNWKDVEFIIFVFKISFLPKYRVKYYDYIVDLCSVI